VAPATFGDPATYALGADFLAGCRTIEDWGCGTGGLRAYVDPARYRGIDGSASAFADEVADLRTYRSRVDGVFLRHVLEHNRDWRAILAGAVASFHRRLVVVLFTPLADGDEAVEVDYCHELGVPDLSLPRAAFVSAFAPYRWWVDELDTASFYGHETIFYVSAAHDAGR
jgi:hypothetical protein